MALGIPSIYSNWGAQLEFAQGKGIPIDITGLLQACNETTTIVGDYCEPNFEHLYETLRDIRKNYTVVAKAALKDSKDIHDRFNWKRVCANAAEIVEMLINPNKINVIISDVEGSNSIKTTIGSEEKMYTDEKTLSFFESKLRLPIYSTKIKFGNGKYCWATPNANKDFVGGIEINICDDYSNILYQEVVTYDREYKLEHLGKKIDVSCGQLENV